MRSQFGPLGALSDRPDEIKALDFRRGTPLWRRSGRARRVVRSTLAAEGYAVSECVEMCLYVRALLSEIHHSPGTQRAVMGYRQLKMPIHVYSDAQSLVTTVLRDVGVGSDRRFAIVVASLREVFTKEGASLTWTPTWKQVADALTKVASSLLLRAVFSGRRVTGGAARALAIACVHSVSHRAHGADVVVYSSSKRDAEWTAGVLVPSVITVLLAALIVSARPVKSMLPESVTWPLKVVVPLVVLAALCVKFVAATLELKVT